MRFLIALNICLSIVFCNLCGSTCFLANVYLHICIYSEIHFVYGKYCTFFLYSAWYSTCTFLYLYFQVNSKDSRTDLRNNDPTDKQLENSNLYQIFQNEIIYFYMQYHSCEELKVEIDIIFHIY
jgi:hypothetical protein